MREHHLHLAADMEAKDKDAALVLALREADLITCPEIINRLFDAAGNPSALVVTLLKVLVGC